ncbi:MAG: hypothetical protein IT384_04635 [Deltaproteobacteria bacterium]|nr:hypothetical protein [Deltaproteobacteria bacterium]
MAGTACIEVAGLLTGALALLRAGGARALRLCLAFGFAFAFAFVFALGFAVPLGSGAAFRLGALLAVAVCLGAAVLAARLTLFVPLCLPAAGAAGFLVFALEAFFNRILAGDIVAQASEAG